VSCAEPVSWLRLEQHHLGELSDDERAGIDQHLAGCAACEHAAGALRSWDHPLPALPAAPVLRRPPRWPWLLMAPAAAAAIALLWPRVPAPGLKGSDVALALVRERGGAVDLEPTTFGPADRFKLLVTCPAPYQLAWDVVVFQGTEVLFPMSARAPIPCANRVPLPGAFRLAGHAPATICLVWGDAIDRQRLLRQGSAALDPRARCERVLPTE
jgi:hypothetical protein